MPGGLGGARKRRQAGAGEADIAARLGVDQSTVSRHLGSGQQHLPGGEEPGQHAVRAGQPARPGEPGGAGRRACSGAGGWAGG